jgi:zinc protease
VPEGRTELAARPQDFDFRSLAKPVPPTVSPPKTDPAPEFRRFRDSFDRNVQPQPGANPIVDLPPVTDARIDNGVRLLTVANTETPTVTIRAVFAMGQRDEPLGKAGLANLTASMMSEATQRRSAAEFSEALERIGASLSVAAGNYEAAVTLNVLSKHLDAGMDLMLERLLEPAFTEEDFERIKSRQMESLMQARKSGPALAARAIDAVLAGPEHPLSFPGGGLPSTVANITLDDVKAFYARHIPSQLQGVLASSSVPHEALLASLQGLAALPVEEADREPVDGLPGIEGRTLFLVEREGAAQSSLRLAHPSLRYDALGDFYLAGLANFNLGGTFDSRINLNLREDKGYTYGIRSGFAGGPDFGSFRVSGEINKEATAAAITELLGELERYAASGMTEAEFEYLQNAVGQADALRYETPGAKLGLLSEILRYDLPLDYRHQQQAMLRQTSRDELNALAGRLLDPFNLAIVVVGDLDQIRPRLEGLNLPIKLLDEEGFEIPME